MADSIFCSWSGGKDCCVALDKYLIENPGVNISLLTMMDERHKTYGHFLNEKILNEQAGAMNLEINFGYSSFFDYEEKWSNELRKLKKKGFTSGIFGDISLIEHYEWIGEIMKGVGMKMLMPLWKQDKQKIVLDFINRQYRAKIISINKTLMDPKYLGREINTEIIDEFKKDGIDPCGEGGEFHTIVYDGPLFKSPLKLELGAVIEEGDHVCYDLQL
ncbi:MAG: diphthine--ammonia ligase [Smithella sp.]